MCGRMQHESRPTWRQIYEYYSIIPSKKDVIDTPREVIDMNPTDPVPIVGLRNGRRRMTLARWWLLPRWATSLEGEYHRFNARADRMIDDYHNKPQGIQGHTFLRPFIDGRRCLIPMNGYYEFKDKRPYLFYLEGRPLFSAAGIWDWNPNVKTPEWPNGVLSCTMITTEPNELAADIHDRMPVLLNPDQYETWLNPTLHATQAFEMLRPYEGDDFRMMKVRIKADDQLRLV